jgi:N-acetylneuraminate synthase/N,N'-diacetyllegionaminate synthase
MHNINISGRWVGPGNPCLIAAEIGINHNGDMDLAKRTIRAAAEAGADAVKFQNYRTEDFICDLSLTYSYESQGKRVEESQYDMFKRYELTRGQLHALKEYCDHVGILFFSTPTGTEGIEELVELGAPMIKNGSDFLVHLQLIEQMARTGIPTILSTGMATLAEIDDAVRAFREAGGTDLILLHCTSSYPAPVEEVHLRKMQTLSRVFDCPVGLSDHSDGVVAALGAAALSACFIEKHFTVDKTLQGPDHRFSADPAELRDLVSSVRTLEMSLGSPRVGPTEAEKPGRKNFRLSCVAATDLHAGHVIEDQDVLLRRPGSGLPPKARAWLLGLRLRRNVNKGHPFVSEDFS